MEVSSWLKLPNLNWFIMAGLTHLISSRALRYCISNVCWSQMGRWGNGAGVTVALDTGIVALGLTQLESSSEWPQVGHTEDGRTQTMVSQESRATWIALLWNVYIGQELTDDTFRYGLYGDFAWIRNEMLRQRANVHIVRCHFPTQYTLRVVAPAPRFGR